jgi:hypothetical protein
LFLITQVKQCRKLRISYRDDVSACPAVPSVGTAPRHELLPAKADAAPAAVAGNNANLDFIDELHASASAVIITVLRAKKKPQTGLSYEHPMPFIEE